MPDQFTPVSDMQAMEELFDRSQEAPVLLFKHDTSCPISAAAYREMSQVKDQVSLVDVTRSKPVSSEIATRTGVRHQSPQVIVLRNGQAVWSASLREITHDAVEHATQENA